MNAQKNAVPVVDFETYNKLTAALIDAKETYGQITKALIEANNTYSAALRQQYNLSVDSTVAAPKDYEYKGVKYPVGSLLRDITYKAKQAKVTPEGFMYEGTLYTSPSAFSSVTRGYKSNGYNFLEIKKADGKRWVRLYKFAGTRES